MATMRLERLDKIAQQLAQLGSGSKEIADAMLAAGGYAAKVILQKEAESHVDTGAMRDSIGYKDPSISRGNIRSTTVYPRGEVTRGNKKVSNALKGFVLNYGSAAKGITGDHWFDEGSYAAEPEAYEQMRRVFQEKIDKIMED